MGLPIDQPQASMAAPAKTTTMPPAQIDLNMSTEQTEAIKNQMPQHRFDRSNLKSLQSDGATIWQYEGAFEDFVSLFFIKFSTLGLIKTRAYLEHEISAFLFTVFLHGSDGRLFLVLDRLLAAKARDLLTTNPTARTILRDILESLYPAEMTKLVVIQGHIDNGKKVEAVLEGIKLQQKFSRKLQGLSPSAPEALRLHAAQLIADHSTRPVYVPDATARLMASSNGVDASMQQASMPAISVPVITAPYAHLPSTSEPDDSIKVLTTKLAKLDTALEEHKSALEVYRKKRVRLEATAGSASLGTTELNVRLTQVENFLSSAPYQQLSYFPPPQSRQKSLVFNSPNNIKGQADFVAFDNESSGFELELEGLKEDISQATEAVGREKAAELQYLKDMNARLDKLVTRYTQFKKKQGGHEQMKTLAQVSEPKPPGAALQNLLKKAAPAEAEEEPEASSNMSKKRKTQHGR